MKKLFIDKTILRRMYIYKSDSQDRIAERLGCSQWVISNRLRHFNIPTRPKYHRLTNKKYSYNTNFLKQLTTDIAWFLGLLVSDGFVRKNRTSFYFGLKLCTRDEDVIFKAKKF